jgi:hypothetical protein
MIRSHQCLRRSAGFCSCTPARMRLLPVLVVLCLAGCGSGAGYKLAPVSGKVTLDGQPLAGATVTFQPEASSKEGTAGPGSAAVTDAAGKFVLQTAEAKRRPGAVVGKHTVRLSGVQDQRAPDDDSARPKVKDPVPLRYREPGLPFDVPAAGTDKADFQLDSKEQPQTRPPGQTPSGTIPS